MKLTEYISRESISGRVAELAKQIAPYLSGPSAVLVSILKGSFVFFSDLVRELHAAGAGTELVMDFIATESYQDTRSTGCVRITKDLGIDIRNRNVLVVEDILDTGLTLSHILHYLKDIHDAKEVRVCVLLDKPSRRKTAVRADYTGFTIDDRFVVGYGLDYNERYRNLPYIAVIDPVPAPLS